MLQTEYELIWILFLDWEDQQGVQPGEGRADGQWQLHAEDARRDTCSTEISHTGRSPTHWLHVLREVEARILKYSVHYIEL